MRLPRSVLRMGFVSSFACWVSSALAITTGAITASIASPDCLAYRVVGICYWLVCTPFGCDVQTSAKVSHYVPDAVVSSYMVTGHNPWIDVAFMSPPNPSAKDGGDGTTNQSHENNLAKFRNGDVIGHPAGAAFSKFAGEFGTVCDGAGVPFTPYLLSVFDTIAWRWNIPESFFPEALTPGLREIGSRALLNLWGNVYPRGGFLHQTDDYKASAVVAQRAGDVVTRPGQIHVYQPLLALPRDGYWPAGPLFETAPLTGRWQELVPTLMPLCAVFPNVLPHLQAFDGGYAWALWRPYSCCQRQGDTFLGSVDFAP
jgi:integrating conjugative element protein (TIGR03756 family)